MGTSEYSYRGVFDKEVSWGIRKQLHLCVLVANRTQVAEIRVFPKGSLTLLQDLVHEWCLTLFRFSVLSAYACSSTNHQLLEGWPPSLGIHFQLCWFPTLLFPITTLQLHLASHTTALPVVPPCFPSHYPMLSTSALDQWLHCAKPFYITTDSSNTFSNFSQRKPKISLINMPIGYFYMLEGQVIWFIFH